MFVSLSVQWSPENTYFCVDVVIIRSHWYGSHRSVLPHIRLRYAIRPTTHISGILDHPSQLSGVFHPDDITWVGSYDSGSIHPLLRAGSYHPLHRWSSDSIRQTQGGDNGRQCRTAAIWWVKIIFDSSSVNKTIESSLKKTLVFSRWQTE